MSDTVQHGHEHHRRDAVITLSSPMLAELDRHQRTAFVAALVEVAGRGLDIEGTVAALHRRLGEAGVEQPKAVVERLGENIAKAGEVTIVTDAGEVLHGDPSWTPHQHDPGVEGTEDPAHGDRPFYT
ncbi:hypothetical protein [Arsenicicoccus sp. oral taxon 190]|uniref:hypothetical protein n=1 Tax=Arsenicicoccus sp. oral taxon 190 TaxID=1658671 RepID=UPI000679FA4A|nr:hypothetical protein [Arsenicicoccus sp. oral taxon 190]AKT50999.1 hypothetical protein ADJ73_06120 [Arsenicicoccus sp. oral taxon 190]